MTNQFKMDRKSEFLEAAFNYLRSQNAGEAKLLEEKSKLLLKPTHKPSEFSAYSLQVALNIDQLKKFVHDCMHDYISSGLFTESDRDRVESEVGAFVKSCNQQIQVMETSVQAGQRSDKLNQQVAAHSHGVVLILAERLHSITMAFDKMRAARYKSLAERESRRSVQPSRVQAYGAQQMPPPTSSAAQHESPARSMVEPGQMQTQTFQSNTLAEELERTSKQVLHLERTMREVATLNQMFSTAVLHQAEQIESIYNAAVDATLNFTRGNEEVRKTIEVNRSTRKYIFVLLLVASLLLLFYDWFSS